MKLGIVWMISGKQACSNVNTPIRGCLQQRRSLEIEAEVSITRYPDNPRKKGESKKNTFTLSSRKMDRFIIYVNCQ